MILNSQAKRYLLLCLCLLRAHRSRDLKVFFYKAHIFAGQARPVEERVTDFAWLTKEEIESYVDKEYWEGTKDMLSDF